MRQHMRGKMVLVETTKVTKIEDVDLGKYVAHFYGSSSAGEGFFYIKDTPCEQTSKDVNTPAILELIQVEVTTKQIEGEFKIMAGEGSTWRWLLVDPTHPLI